MSCNIPVHYLYRLTSLLSTNLNLVFHHCVIGQRKEKNDDGGVQRSNFVALRKICVVTRVIGPDAISSFGKIFWKLGSKKDEVVTSYAAFIFAPLLTF